MKFGWKKDPTPGDEKHPRITGRRKFSAIRANLTAVTSNSVHILPEATPISDQGPLSSCVANATCDSFELLLGIQNDVVVQLSRLFTYYNARAYHAGTELDEGTYIHYAFLSIRDHGVCAETDWVYDVAKVNKRPELICYTNADGNTINGFYRIDEDDSLIDDIATAIKANHPVVFGTAVSKSFTEYGGTKDLLWMSPVESEIVGQHAMAIVGVKDSHERSFLVRNSWGRNWGDSGYCWMHESYIKSRYSNDFWVATRTDPNIDRNNHV